MSRELSFAEIDGQHVELLPARTVMSLFSAGGDGDGGSNIVQGPTCSTYAPSNGLVANILLGGAPQALTVCQPGPASAASF